MTITAVLVLFFIFGDPTQIGVMGSPSMILYVVLTLLQNGSNMCITTSNTSYMADAIDFELDRSGRYVPAVVSGTYSLVDKLITSFAAVIATGAVALLGYTTTMPQPTDPCTSAIFWMTLSLKFGLPLIGWVITLVAMRECPLTKEEMVNVQKRIAEKRLLRSLSSIKNSFSKPINQSRKGLQPFQFFEVKTTHKESFYEQSNSVEHRLDFYQGRS